LCLGGAEKEIPQFKTHHEATKTTKNVKIFKRFTTESQRAPRKTKIQVFGLNL